MHSFIFPFAGINYVKISELSLSQTTENTKQIHHTEKTVIDINIAMDNLHI